MYLIIQNDLNVYVSGICRNVKGIPNEFSCECINSHQGRRCEYGKFCIPNPCLHGGTCVEGPLSFMCLCQPGFSGKISDAMKDPNFQPPKLFAVITLYRGLSIEKFVLQMVECLTM